MTKVEIEQKLADHDWEAAIVDNPDVGSMFKTSGISDVDKFCGCAQN